MDEKKQIEEMVKELRTVWIVDWEGNPHELHEKLWDDELENIAIELYNLRYRKQSEGEWIPNPGGGWLCGNCRKYSHGLRNFCPECGAKMKGGEGDG